jgi:hypothetical protein
MTQKRRAPTTLSFFPSLVSIQSFLFFRADKKKSSVALTIGHDKR